MLKIHHLVTGELESSLSVSLLNEGAHPALDQEQIRPFGFRTDIRRLDGTASAGVMVPVPVWLIEGTEQTILIDTGLGDIGEINSIQPKYGVPFVASRGPDQDLIAQLDSKGISPEDVDCVVLTHLHFDHIGNNDLFPRARFIVQRDELAQALVPPDFCMFYYPEYSSNVWAVRDRLEVIDGDHRLCDGVRLLKIGGHTPGCMVVLVDTGMGRVCLTSDVMYNYRNLEMNWPMGSFWNLQELMRGYQRIRGEADIIVPEHDWQFRQHFPSGTVG